MTFLMLSVTAQDISLSQLPYDMKLGATNISELSQKVTSTSESIKEEDEGETRFSMSGGKFDITVSVDGTLDRVIFEGDSKHALPKKWKLLDVRLSNGKDCDAFGTSKQKFIEIIKDQQAIFIEHVGYDDLTFVIDDLLFSAQFNDVCGLNNLVITEHY